MVVLKGLPTFSYLVGCCHLERNDFQEFPLWQDVVVLKATDLGVIISFRRCGVLKGLILKSVLFGKA